MDNKSRAEVLALINDLQKDTSSLVVQIGGTDDNTNIIEHDSLYIKDAPAHIINELIDAGYRLSVVEDGVEVR